MVGTEAEDVEAEAIFSITEAPTFRARDAMAHFSAASQSLPESLARRVSLKNVQEARAPIGKIVRHIPFKISPRPAPYCARRPPLNVGN